MIVFNHDVLFVHSPKTAGTSIIDALARSLPRAKVAGVDELGTHHPHFDQALSFARAVTGQTAFKCMFVVARDPYDREVSHYTYFRDVLYGSPLATRNLNNVGLQAAVKLAFELPFKDYLKQMQASFGTCDLWRSRYYYESETSGRIPDLHILRFETLATELAALLDGHLAAPLDLPFLNKGRREDVHAYYDEEARAVVTSSYAWMFARGLYARHPEDDAARAVRDLAALIPNVDALLALNDAMGDTERRVRELAARLDETGTKRAPARRGSRRPAAR